MHLVIHLWKCSKILQTLDDGTISMLLASLCSSEHLQIFVPIKQGHTLRVMWPITPSIRNYKEGPCSASPLLGSKSSNKYGESGSTLLRRSAIARFKGSLLGGSKSFCAGGFGSHRSLPFVATDSLIRATTTELPPEWAELLGRKALLYVSDTTNLAQLGAELVRLGFTLVSFGDTLSFLEESGLPVERINTNDMFVGVFMGTIGIVVLNFYSNQRNFTFKGDVRDIDHGLTQLIVNIVKDHNDTLVAVDSVEYPAVIDYLIEEDRKRHLRYYPIEDEASIKREGFHDELVWKACSHVFRYLRAISDQAATYCE